MRYDTWCECTVAFCGSKDRKIYRHPSFATHARAYTCLKIAIKGLKIFIDGPCRVVLVTIREEVFPVKIKLPSE